MDRRRFLGAILASACAPAIVRASSLMPIYARVPDIYNFSDEVLEYIQKEIEPLARRTLVAYQFGKPIELIGIAMRDTLDQNVYRTFTNAS